MLIISNHVLSETKQFDLKCEYLHLQLVNNLLVTVICLELLTRLTEINFIGFVKLNKYEIFAKRVQS